ncbi:TPA: hypothetical protein ACJIMR_000259 [Escherichia coli]
MSGGNDRLNLNEPPVRMPDGSISAGSKLAANHLNTLLNDLYTQISDLKARVTELEGA